VPAKPSPLTIFVARLLMLRIPAAGAGLFARRLLHMQLLHAQSLRLQHLPELPETVTQQLRRLIAGCLERCAHHSVQHPHRDLKPAQFRRIKTYPHSPAIGHQLAANRGYDSIMIRRDEVHFRSCRRLRNR